MSMTVSSLVTDVMGGIADVAPDLSIFIGGTLVVGLIAYGFRRVVKAAR